MSNGRPTDVLLVEDEAAFVDALVVALKRERFSVRVAGEGGRALEMFEAAEPDLVLLDVVLPDMSGIDVCRTVRRRSDVPIIMLSGKSAEVDKVIGLEVGADDYVVKPYGIHELIARMRALLRRASADSRADEPPAFTGHDVRLDRERREVTLHGEKVKLPLKEFELLELLMANAGKVVTRKTIIDRVWGLGYVGDTKTLDVHIRRLRRRLDDDLPAPRRIVTVRGVGFRFEPDLDQP